MFKEPWERDTCVVISIIVGRERSETTISVTSQRKRRECEFRCQPRDCATECPLPLALQYYLSCRHKGLQTYRMLWPRSNYKFCEIALLCRKQKSYSSEALTLHCFYPSCSSSQDITQTTKRPYYEYIQKKLNKKLWQYYSDSVLVFQFVFCLSESLVTT